MSPRLLIWPFWLFEFPQLSPHVIFFPFHLSLVFFYNDKADWSTLGSVLECLYQNSCPFKSPPSVTFPSSRFSWYYIPVPSSDHVTCLHVCENMSLKVGTIRRGDISDGMRWCPWVRYNQLFKIGQCYLKTGLHVHNVGLPSLSYWHPWHTSTSISTVDKFPCNM